MRAEICGCRRLSSLLGVPLSSCCADAVPACRAQNPFKQIFLQSICVPLFPHLCIAALRNIASIQMEMHVSKRIPIPGMNMTSAVRPKAHFAASSPRIERLFFGTPQRSAQNSQPTWRSKNRQLGLGEGHRQPFDRFPSSKLVPTMAKRTTEDHHW